MRKVGIDMRRKLFKTILDGLGGELGGNILCERNVPFKARLHRYIGQQKDKLRRLGVDVRLNTAVTHDEAAAMRPDAVICAIGSGVVKPPLPGIDGGNVHSAVETFADPSLAQGRVVILGAGLAGTELAIYLKDLGREVEVVEMGPGINNGGNSCHGIAVLDMIQQKKIPIHANTRAVEITERGVRCTGPEGEIFFEADAVVYAAGMRPRREEAMLFCDVAPIFHMVGDCKTSSTILHATGNAYTAAKFLGRYC